MESWIEGRVWKFCLLEDQKELERNLNQIVRLSERFWGFFEFIFQMKIERLYGRRGVRVFNLIVMVDRLQVDELVVKEYGCFFFLRCRLILGDKNREKGLFGKLCFWCFYFFIQYILFSMFFCFRIMKIRFVLNKQKCQSFFWRKC